MKVLWTISIIAITFSNILGQVKLQKQYSSDDRPDSLWYDGFPKQFINGFLLFKQGNFESSERVFNDFVESEKSDSLKSFGYYWLAMIQSQHNNPAKAIELIDQSIDLYETYYYVHYRGRFNYQNGDLKQAIKDYTRAIKLDPEFSESYTWRGIARLYRGQVNNACLDFYEGANRGSDEAYGLLTQYCQRTR